MLPGAPIGIARGPAPGRILFSNLDHSACRSRRVPPAPSPPAPLARPPIALERIANMQQQFGPAPPLRASRESWSLAYAASADKSHPCRTAESSCARKLQLPQLRVERGKHARRLQHPSLSQCIELECSCQRCVTDQRNHRHRHSLPPLTLLADECAAPTPIGLSRGRCAD